MMYDCIVFLPASMTLRDSNSALTYRPVICRCLRFVVSILHSYLTMPDGSSKQGVCRSRYFILLSLEFALCGSTGTRRYYANKPINACITTVR